MICIKKFYPLLFVLTAMGALISCQVGDAPKDRATERSSKAAHPEPIRFTSSSSSSDGLVYEILPGPAVLDPSKSPTPFSNKTNITSGNYSYTIADNSPKDSKNSTDAVTAVNINFTGNNGQNIK